VSIIGFGTHPGTVAAAADWDEPMEVMKVVPSRRDIYEILGHETGLSRFLLDLREGHMDKRIREQYGATIVEIYWCRVPSAN
jgi:erythromycin esterase-like protein